MAVLFLTTASTCGKVGGGGIPNVGPATIKFDNPDGTIAKIKDGTNILLKASGFPSVIETKVSAASFEVMHASPANTRKRAFDFIIEGATGGIVVVERGSVASAKDITIPPPAAIPLRFGTQTRTWVTPLRSTATNFDLAGMNIFSIFMDRGEPTSAEQVKPDVAPFAFTKTGTGGFSTGDNADRRPIVVCRTVISTLTTAATAETKLTGGQKAECFASNDGGMALGGNGDSWQKWLDQIAKNPTTKKRSFYVAVIAIRTDERTVSQIGLTGDDNDAKVATFNDGLSKEDIAAMVDANTADYKKFLLTVVSDTEFSN